MEKTFAMISLGCAKNLVNSEQMLYLLANPEACDAIEKEIRENAHKLLTPQAKRAAMVSGRTPTAVDITAADFTED